MARANKNRPTPASPNLFSLYPPPVRYDTYKIQATRYKICTRYKLREYIHTIVPAAPLTTATCHLLSILVYLDYSTYLHQY